MYKKIIHFIVSFFFCSGIFSQISFEASVSKNRLGINERLRVVFEMNENGDNFIPPNFNGFRIIGGPNQSVSNSWINGKRTFSKKLTYFLAPKIKGNLIIGQAQVEINGEVYKTSPVNIEITEAVANASKDSNNADYIADNNIHLVAEVSNQNPYLNEAFTVVYKLYYSDQVGISNVNELDRPKYPDFWSHVIKIPRLEAKQGLYKGSPYKYVTWHKTVLYPQKTGKLTIAPLTLNVSVDIPTNRRDFFGNRLYQQVPKVITAGQKIINVKDLPEKGKPKNFSGAVGDFDLNISMNKTELNASESFQAKINVSGRGNLKLFKLPEINVPGSLEVYEPEYNENVKTNLKGMQGDISNIYTIVPQNQGKFPIPSVEFSFFDPITEDYVFLKSEKFIINVLESPDYINPQGTFNQNSKKLKSTTINESKFNFIKLETDLEPVFRNIFWGSNMFNFILLLPFLLLIVFGSVVLIYKKRNQDRSLNRVIRANKLARKYLISAKKTIGEKDLFYEALERALHNFLKAKLNIETTDLNKEKIRGLLTNKSIDKETAQLFVTLLKDCELARYSPSTSVRIQEDYNNAVNAISRIDKQI